MKENLKEIVLRARPSRLESAVAALPAARSGPARRPPRADALRARLLQLPVSQLAQSRLHPQALALLPVLAEETRNAELRARVCALAIHNLASLDWPTLARLLAYTFAETELRRQAHRRARRHAPDMNAPRWVRVHWRAGLGREVPAETLARAVLAEQPVFARLPGALELPPRSPLAEKTMHAALSLVGDGALGRQPYTETLRFVESGPAPLSVRRALLERVIARYQPAGERAMQEELLALAQHISGASGCARTTPG